MWFGVVLQVKMINDFNANHYNYLKSTTKCRDHKLLQTITGDPSEDESNLKIITGAAVGIAVLVLVFLLILFWKCRNKIKSLSTCQKPQTTSASTAGN